ncbi:MAG: DUF3179 domain-containing protein [Gammaproteobacteria bacterium]|nr:DUF3179 domain-containing protein [Gammaproteobacteria bacterium]
MTPGRTHSINSQHSFSLLIYRLLASLTTLFLCTSFVHAQSFKHAWPNTDFNIQAIDLKEIMSGGPPRDGIPPIDHPEFDSVTAATSWVAPLEPVISVILNGQAKAYPLQIMTWHEIVNDHIGNTPITVTFCPLCNASIVFDRRLEDTLLDFGTTGLLRKSDLVMYDRQTEGWWQQFTGTAIVGDYTHATLTRIPSSIISFQSFATSHPEGQVLNRETSAIRPYGNNPYPGYDDINSSPFLLSDPTDPRLPPMERVIGVQVGGQIDGQHKIYPFSLFDNTSIIQDEILDTKLLIFRAGDLLSALDQRTIAESKVVAEVVAWDRTLKDTNQTLNFHLESGVLVDKETNSRWSISGKAISGPLAGQQLAAVDSGIHFSFAWLAFNPDTLIHSMDE